MNPWHFYLLMENYLGPNIEVPSLLSPGPSKFSVAPIVSCRVLKAVAWRAAYGDTEEQI